MTANTVPEDPDAIRGLVRERYAAAAGACCGGSCAPEFSEKLGYEPEQLASVPKDANLGLGCGNPGAIASLKPGEVVLDLGSGGGLDALLAAKAVGAEGRVIGVDMTPAMLERARRNAVGSGVARYVEFREGTIEALPVVSESVDVVISNCVINLSPDKPAVFREAFRVLKSGGRLAVSDLLLTEPLPRDIAKMASAYVGCIGGATLVEAYLGALTEAGFVDIHHERKSAASLIEAALDDPAMVALLDGQGQGRILDVAKTVFSYSISARKP